MPNNVNVASAFFTTRISTAARDTYKTAQEQLGALGNLFEKETAESRTKLLGYYHSAPVPVLKRRGDTIREASFDSTSYEGEVLKFAVKVGWNVDDAADDQLGGLEKRAREVGTRFGLLDNKAAIQYITGTNDPDGIPVLANAPDGVGLFSATDGGGGDRFGVSGGNIVTGNQATSSDAIEEDVYQAMVRFGQFLDTVGETLMPENFESAGYTIYAPIEIRRFFEKALRSEWVSDGTTTTSNILIVNGVKYTFYFTRRLTDDSWYIQANGAMIKPLTILERGGLMTLPFDESTSDDAAEMDREGIRFKLRRGWVPNLPLGIIKIDNS